MKCVLCKVGNIVLSGSHEYCDNCRFCRFVVTDDYIDACTKVLAVLMSNTKFNDSEAAAYFVKKHIEDHLPKLYQFLTSLDNGMQQLTDEIIKLTFEQAINLQVNGEQKGQVENEDELTCQCGSQSFKPISTFELICKDCDAVYRSSSETEGRWEPVFLCECGQAAYESEDNSDLVFCKGCGDPYLHVKQEDGKEYFQKVGD